MNTPEGLKIRAQVWEEMVGILEEKVPNVRQVLNGGK